MRSAAGAFAWELGWRHRWAWVALLAYPLFGIAFRLLVMGPDHVTTLDPLDPLSATVIAPFPFLFLYLLAVFSYGLDGDLAGRRSIYPARMFTLPVTTTLLVGWPMWMGATVVAGHVLGTALLVRWAWNLDLPLAWPPLYGATFLAWTQVLAWRPFRVRGLRVLLAVIWLATINGVVFCAVTFHVPEYLMVAILLPQLPLAFLCARRGVARARRGEESLGLWTSPRLTWRAPTRRPPFASPAHAQRWMDWRRHGISLPVWVGVLLLFELALMTTSGRGTPHLVLTTLVAMVLTPPFMAAFASATPRGSSSGGPDPWGLSPFLATRPLTAAEFALARMTVALQSTLCAWVLVLVAAPLGITLSGTWPLAREWARLALEVLGPPRALALLLLALAGSVVSTWLQLVHAWSISLAGREWLVRLAVIPRVVLLVFLLPLLDWLAESDDALVAAVRLLPCLLGSLVVVSLGLASWVGGRIVRERLVSHPTVLALAAGWLLAILALDRLFVWLVAGPPFVPPHLTLLAAILAVPLLRPALLPLALVWNRHRGARRPLPLPKRGRFVLGAFLLLLWLPAALALGRSTVDTLQEHRSGVVTSSHRNRSFLLYVPDSYRPDTPAPLVVSLHGGGVWPRLQMRVSRWNRVADDKGLLVLYPSGSGFPPIWRTQQPGAPLREDVRYLEEVIDLVTGTYSIDPGAVFVDGLSNGGGMAFALSCARPDRIAAIGMVASAQFLPVEGCGQGVRTPAIVVHGQEDQITPYHGGRSFLVSLSLPDIPTWVEALAGSHRCQEVSRRTFAAPGVHRDAWSGCEGGADVELYTVQDGGHTWPGGEPLPEWLAGRTNTSLDATGLLWSFFEAHRR